VSRTPEQRKADDNLTEAIDAVRKAYDCHGEIDGFLMTDYVVIYAAQKYDKDGDSLTALGIMPRDADVPLYRLMGMGEYAVAQWCKRATEDCDHTP
jgi:hypothetical protein